MTVARSLISPSMRTAIAAFASEKLMSCELSTRNRMVVAHHAAVRQGDVHKLLFCVRWACGLVQCSALPFVCESHHVLAAIYARAQATAPREKHGGAAARDKEGHVAQCTIEALRPGSPDAHDLMKRGCSNAAGPMQRSNQGRRTTHEISIVPGFVSNRSNTTPRV